MYWAFAAEGRNNAAQTRSAVRIENRTRSRVRFMIETPESFRLGGGIGSGEWENQLAGSVSFVTARREWESEGEGDLLIQA
jgi:hypothetical protein